LIFLLRFGVGERVSQANRGANAPATSTDSTDQEHTPGIIPSRG